MTELLYRLCIPNSLPSLLLLPAQRDSLISPYRISPEVSPSRFKFGFPLFARRSRFTALTPRWTDVQPVNSEIRSWTVGVRVVLWVLLAQIVGDGDSVGDMD
jgi:hypothetical protein